MSERSDWGEIKNLAWRRKADVQAQFVDIRARIAVLAAEISKATAEREKLLAEVSRIGKIATAMDELLELSKQQLFWLGVPTEADQDSED